MSGQTCTCYEIAETREVLFLRGGHGWWTVGSYFRKREGRLLHARTTFKIPMPKRQHTTERISIILIGNRVLESFADETRPMPSPQRGHRKDCPFYVPARPQVSKKRRRQVLHEARVESMFAHRLGRRKIGTPRPKPGKVSQNITLAIPHGTVKLMRSRGFWRPEMLDRGWYSPKPPKPPRRGKGSESKPRGRPR